MKITWWIKTIACRKSNCCSKQQIQQLHVVWKICSKSHRVSTLKALLTEYQTKLNDFLLDLCTFKIVSWKNLVKIHCIILQVGWDKEFEILKTFLQTFIMETEREATVVWECLLDWIPSSPWCWSLFLKTTEKNSKTPNQEILVW